jgi:hypothetical protein
MSNEELVKYEKIITLNDTSFDIICKTTKTLLCFMEENNSKEGMYTEFFCLRFTDSERNNFGKDLKLQWACLPIKKNVEYV